MSFKKKPTAKPVTLAPIVGDVPKINLQALDKPDYFQMRQSNFSNPTLLAPARKGGNSPPQGNHLNALKSPHRLPPPADDVTGFQHASNFNMAPFSSPNPPHQAAGGPPKVSPRQPLRPVDTSALSSGGKASQQQSASKSPRTDFHEEDQHFHAMLLATPMKPAFAPGNIMVGPLVDQATGQQLTLYGAVAQPKAGLTPRTVL